jgi:hypothetical protein
MALEHGKSKQFPFSLAALPGQFDARVPWAPGESDEPLSGRICSTVKAGLVALACTFYALE